MPKVEDAAAQVEDMVEEAATENTHVSDIVDEVLTKLDSDPDLMQAFVPVALRRALKDMAYRTQNQMREAAEHAARDTAASLRADCAREAMDFWDSYTVMGVALREATYEALSNAVGMKERQAAGKLRRASFEKRVLARMDEGDAVSDKWTLEEIEELAGKKLENQNA